MARVHRVFVESEEASLFSTTTVQLHILIKYRIIHFLSGGPDFSDAAGSFAENQRIVTVRRAYHSGLVTPLVGLEQLWKDYAAFETVRLCCSVIHLYMCMNRTVHSARANVCMCVKGVNPALAKKMLEERQRDYMNARRVVREMESVTRGLMRAAPALPPRALSFDLHSQVRYIVHSQDAYSTIRVLRIHL